MTGNNASPTWSAIQTLPFSFDFNGTAVTDYKSFFFGVLTFTTAAATAPAYTNAAIPNANIPDNSVLLWGLAGTGANDEIVTQTFGTAGARQHWVFFSSYDGGGSWSYWSIVLEEGSNKIYLVDQRHGTTAAPALTAGIQINATEAYSVAGSPSLSNLAAQDPTDADNYYYEFIQGTLPGDNIEMTSISTPTIANTGSNVSIAGTITNLGGNTVTSVDVTWDDGSGPNTETISGLNIVTYGTYNFTHGTQLNVANATAYNLTVCAEITGVVDVDSSNNCTTHSVSGLGFMPTRHVLIEEGTVHGVDGALEGAVAMETLNSDASRPNFVGVAVHNGDPMTVTAYDNGANFSGFPGMNVNRKYLGESVSTSAMEGFMTKLLTSPQIVTSQ